MIKKLILSVFFTPFFFLIQDVVASPIDSLGIERNGSKVFVLHKVELNQTLYSILKRYKCSQQDFMLANPSIANPQKINYGQIVKVPISTPINTNPAAPTKKDMEIVEIIDAPKPATQNTQQNQNNTKQTTALIHKVVAGETLFSIARKYGLSVDELRRLNQLSSDKVTVSQSIIIRKGTTPQTTNPAKPNQNKPNENSNVPKTDTPVINPTQTPKVDSVANKNTNSNPSNNSNPSKDTEKKETPKASGGEKKEVPKEMKIGLGVDGDFRQGNIQRNLLKARGFMEFEHPKSIFGISTSPRWAYGTFKGVKNEDELFVDVNATLFAYQRKLYYLAFGIYEQSNLRKITSRLLGGAGIGYRILGDKNNPKSRFKMAITTAITYEKTDYYTRQDIEVYRSSTRFKFSGELIKNKLYFNNITFFQPALNQKNLRWNAISSLSVKFSKVLAMSINFENSYESVVPEGLKNTDMALTFGINYNGRLGL